MTPIKQRPKFVTTGFLCRVGHRRWLYLAFGVVNLRYAIFEVSAFGISAQANIGAIYGGPSNGSDNRLFNFSMTGHSQSTPTSDI